MTPEQRGEAGLAVVRALIREQQLLEAVQPLDELLDGDALEPVGHELGLALGLVRFNLRKLGDVLSPVADTPAAGAAPPHQETTDG